MSNLLKNTFLLSSRMKVLLQILLYPLALPDDLLIEWGSVHLFIEQILLSIRYVAGILQIAEDAMMSKTDMALALTELTT